MDNQNKTQKTRNGAMRQRIGENQQWFSFFEKKMKKITNKQIVYLVVLTPTLVGNVCKVLELIFYELQRIRRIK